jgi:hypothetical protein
MDDHAATKLLVLVRSSQDIALGGLMLGYPKAADQIRTPSQERGPVSLMKAESISDTKAMKGIRWFGKCQAISFRPICPAWHHHV